VREVTDIPMSSTENKTKLRQKRNCYIFAQRKNCKASETALLHNGCLNTTMEQLLGAVFSVRSVPGLSSWEIYGNLALQVGRFSDETVKYG
jgi:hypothetical protein